MPVSDYQRIERAIHFLEENARRQPNLREVAASAGLSEFHFQRMFTRWAGVSPKRFLQFQTIHHAKRLLESQSLLHASYQAGLSGPSRLHDLFVNVEAVTPGEFKSGGAELTIQHGVHDGPFGKFLLATTDRGVCGLSFLTEEGETAAVEELESRWPRARLHQSTAATAPLAARIFSRTGEAGKPAGLSLHLKGTNFQLKVWEALLRIPVGGVASYEEIALAAGVPGAVRAVGAAVGRNPVAWLVPCHRVIRKSGAFGDYQWGTARKRAMLGWEAGRVA